MATKVPSSVLDRESPAKGFATKPRRFSTLYGICKRGIIYFYSTVKIDLFFVKFLPYGICHALRMNYRDIIYTVWCMIESKLLDCVKK